MKTMDDVMALSAQEMFDIALRDTKVPSFHVGPEYESPSCQYRSLEGNHFAVGKIMLAVFGNDQRAEFENPISVTDLVLNECANEFDEDKVTLLGHIQSLHDRWACRIGNSPEWRDRFVSGMREIAEIVLTISRSLSFLNNGLLLKIKPLK